MTADPHDSQARGCHDTRQTGARCCRAIDDPHTLGKAARILRTAMARQQTTTRSEAAPAREQPPQHRPTEG